MLAQGKPCTLGDDRAPWWVRLDAPEDSGATYRVMYRARPARASRESEPFGRADSEEETRKNLPRAKTGLDTEKGDSADADVRASRSVEILAKE